MLIFLIFKLFFLVEKILDWTAHKAYMSFVRRRDIWGPNDGFWGTNKNKRSARVFRSEYWKQRTWTAPKEIRSTKMGASSTDDYQEFHFKISEFVEGGRGMRLPSYSHYIICVKTEIRYECLCMQLFLRFYVWNLAFGRTRVV